MAAEKARLRERFQATRMAMPEPDRADASGRLVERLLGLPEIHALSRGSKDPASLDRRTVALFVPRVSRAEVDVLPLFGVLRRRHIPTALPRVDGPGRMTWHAWDGEAGLGAGPWGLREPGPDEPRVDPADIALVVVPGLAFGRDGTRLGWGGGYYDRALAETDAVTVGVTFSTALSDPLPATALDVRMDLVVTEHETIRCGSP